METEKITLPWGNEQLSAALPAGWRVADILKPTPVPGVIDAVAETACSLQSPIGSPRLAEIAHPGMSVALVIDDDSRPTPVAQIFPAVLAELQQAGISLDQVTVIPALGVHRPMTQEEVTRRVGQSSFAALRSESHDCDDPAKLAFLGSTRRGTPVYINRTAAQSDLIVSIGCIEPHIIASFGGGYKNLIPGIAGRKTIAHNHALNCQPATFNNVGLPIERNPMRLDLEEGAQMLKAPVFIVNAVLNSALQVVKIVSGHPIEAHRAGVRISASIYGVSVPAVADVLIASSHPMDQDLRQGVKALANNIRSLRPGGTMITLVRAAEGVGVFGLANRKLPVGRRALKLLGPLLLPLVPKLKIKGMGEEDRFFLYFALQAMRRGNLLMYAPTIPAEIQERLPFVTFVQGIEDALARARQNFPREADVLIVPHGGSTYPILNN
jgi:nickel-dependent lactate racemase